MRTICDHLFRDGGLLLWGIPATGVLVESLLDDCTAADMAEAQAAIERLVQAPADDALAVREIWLLRLQALLARAQGDDARCHRYRDQYRDMAEAHRFEGHLDWVADMT
jgi:hypothetical protein